MHDAIMKAEEKLMTLKSALAGFEGRNLEAQGRLAQARAESATDERELYELRVQAVLDESVRQSVPSKQKAATKQRELVEALEIETIALGRRIDELHKEITQTEDTARKIRNGVILEKALKLRERYSADVNKAIQSFELLSVCVAELSRNGGRADLKQVSPELLQFPQATHSAEVGANAWGFVVLEVGHDGNLKKTFPFRMSKERKNELMNELLK